MRFAHLADKGVLLDQIQQHYRQQGIRLHEMSIVKIRSLLHGRGSLQYRSLQRQGSAKSESMQDLLANAEELMRKRKERE